MAILRDEQGQVLMAICKAGHGEQEVESIEALAVL